ncbi:MAG: nucleotide exchange factor GrpE [Rickettsiales bacterium]|jgi:molecular chaperone GrpE|nr:nucleotide exchange factor GrpE [Rickettsiales bacterium]
MENEIEEIKPADADDAANNNQTAGTESDGPQIDTLNAQISELNDKYLRLAAELENTRRRAALDTENAARNRVMSVAGNFLPVADAIDAALAHNPNDAGIQAMARAVESAMAKTGIVKMEPLGQPLNPQFHNAVQVAETTKSDEPCAAKPAPNTVVGELQAGYMFGDSVLRPAMVVVSK